MLLATELQHEHLTEQEQKLWWTLIPVSKVTAASDHKEWVWLMQATAG